MVSFQKTGWIVLLHRNAVRDLRRLPREIVELVSQLRKDFEREGPWPEGWQVKVLQGQPGSFAVRLKREYRLIFEFIAPRIIVLRVAHRKEVYRHVS